VKQPLQVLIVEDSADDATLLEIELGRAGYEPRCHRVDTAQAMAAALESQSWDLIVADYRMPRFNGLAALALVKEKGLLDVPFIIVSGLITDADAVAAMKAGAHDYVMKDNLARLGAAVDRELREAEVRRQRRRSEAQFQTERALREAIENSVPAGVAAVDLDGKQTYVNPAFCALVGRTEEQLVGARPPFAYWPPEEIDKITESLGNVVEGHSPAGGLEMRFRRPDEERFDVLVQITPLADAFGNIVGWVSSALDITQRKRAEARLAAEHAITRLLAKAPSFTDAAPSIAQTLLDGLGLEACVFWFPDPDLQSLSVDSLKYNPLLPGLSAFAEETSRRNLPCGVGLPGRVWRERQALWVADLDHADPVLELQTAVKAGLRSAAAFPVESAGDFFGVLEFFSGRPMDRDPAQLNMMSAIGSEIAQFIQRRKAEDTAKRMFDELETRVEQRTADLKRANAELEAAIAQRKRLEQELLEITEKERRRIGLDLHDDLGQKLSGLALMTKALQLKLDARQAGEAREAANIHNLVQQAMNHARDLAQDLATLDLDAQSLPAALEGLARHATDLFKISCQFQAEGDIPPLAPNVVRQLYKIAQEAVTNAIKHAKAKRVGITLSNGSDHLVMTIRNNGRPFPEMKEGTPGMGLRIMNYRAGLIGGSIEIKGTGPNGTRVTCAVPCPAKK